MEPPTKIKTEGLNKKIKQNNLKSSKSYKFINRITLFEVGNYFSEIWIEIYILILISFMDQHSIEEVELEDSQLRSKSRYHILKGTTLTIVLSFVLIATIAYLSS